MWLLRPNAHTGVAYSDFEGVPEIFRRRYVDSDEILRVAFRLRAISDPSLRLREAFNEYVSIRLRNYPRYAKFQISHLLKSDVTVLSTGAAGAVGGCTSSKWAWLGLVPKNIFIFLDPRVPRDSALYYATLAHELEHVIQGIDLRTVNLGAFDKAHRQYFMEFGTTRAEYEFLQLLPKASIDESLAILKTFPESDRKIGTLQASVSSFTEYRAAHQYGTFESTMNVYRSLYGERVFEDP